MAPADVPTYAVRPAHVIHQIEEHDDDRFRRFVPIRLAGGRKVLMPVAVFVIDLVGGWLLMVLVTI